MDKVEAIRAIGFDQLEYIQTKIRVDFDNKKQEPIGIFFRGENYLVENVLGRFRTTSEEPANGFLVQVTGEKIFFLYSQLMKIHRQRSIEQGFWVLSFRILNDHELLSWYLEDRKMLGNISLKRAVNFHGHICPELAIGSKFCEFVQGLFNDGSLSTSGFSIIAENTTSALDAIQVLLGTTVGNQRLQVMDFGKHNYTLLSHSLHCGWRLKQKSIEYEDQPSYVAFEEKIRTNQASLEEVLAFQKLLDRRVQHILTMPPEKLFTIEETKHDHPLKESTSLYVQCDRCGEQMLASRSIKRDHETLCLPCLQLDTDELIHCVQ